MHENVEISPGVYHKANFDLGKPNKLDDVYQNNLGASIMSTESNINLMHPIHSSMTSKLPYPNNPCV